MSYEVSQIQGYVEQKKSELLGKAVMGAKTIGKIGIQTGVKGNTALNQLTTNFSFKNGNTCGFSPEGNASFTQRILEPTILAVQLQFCPKDLINTYKNEEVRISAQGGDMPAEEAVVDNILKNVKAKLETAIWKGDEATGMKGFKSINTEGKVAVNYTDKATVYEKAVAVYSAIPVEILDAELEVSIFMGADQYRTFVQEMVAKNLYHYNANEGIGGEIYLPGTNVKIVSTNGLNGTNEMWATFNENLVYGTDFEGDEEIFDLWYSNDDRVWKLDIEFNAATQVRFPDLLVVGSNA